MGIIWIIIIGLVAGLIARWISPGPNSPSGFLLTVALFSELRGHSSRPGSVRRSVGIDPTKVRALSALRSARCWCCSSGTAWSRCAGHI